MSARQPEPHTLAGAYAMDALDGPDRARFERHLERCEECTREVAGLHEAAARLAAAAAAPPRPLAAARGPPGPRAARLAGSAPGCGRRS